MIRSLFIWPIALFALVLMLAAGSVWAQPKVPQSQAEISLSFAPLVRQAAPAVVNIYARKVSQGRVSPFQDDPFFRDFFRGFGTPQPRVQNSLGSGVILSEDGIVVSNYHVVGEATDIRVVLTDRREFAARVLLGDADSDLAILQLDGATALPALPLRDSDQVEVGELVLAIGNPFGVGQTVSSGIVSGLARSGTATGAGRGYFIQTDAPINPGNSGGALIDMAGRLIGINTRILSRSGGSNGIGFAIPAGLVAQYVAQARAGNTVFERPWAGMVGQPVNADLAASLGLDTPEGIIVSDLHPLSPFAAAGIRVGDVIVGVDDAPVNSPAEMLFRMSVTGIGGVSDVAFMRRGQAQRATVPMILAPDDPPAETTTLTARTVLPGLRVARANPAVIGQFGLPLMTRGVVTLDPGQLGARVGLQPGDSILAVNGVAVARPRDLARALTRPPNRVELEVSRRGQRLALRFRL
ncbi:MAG: trypsin-like peptidase domain-containing protein [Rhodobacteraceae bacterium]|nr:trypsin-like peptidase domain-containing protein [Paracoccaceae bacterium]